MSVTTTGTVPCPDCDRTFQNMHGLNVHRVRTHNINPNGSHRSKKPHKPRYRTMYCEVCDKGPFRNKATLGSHMRKTHGIAGKSRSAVDKRVKREREQKPDQKPVPDCAFCPACGMNLVIFRRAMEIAANADH